MRRSIEDPLVITPLWWEGVFLAFGAEGVPVMRSGIRAHRWKRIAADLRRNPSSPVIVAGVAGGLGMDLRAGDLIVPEQVWSGTAVRRCPSAPLLRTTLQRWGATVHRGPIVEVDHIANLAEKTHRAHDDVIAVDMESARLLELLESRPAAVIRAVVDTPRQPLRSPMTPIRGMAALASLRRVAPVIRQWAQAVGCRRVITDRTHRPGAVSRMARECDLVVLAASRETTDTQKLVESLQWKGAHIHRVCSVAEIDVTWLGQASTVGVLRNTSVSRTVVDEIVDAVGGLGEIEVVERDDRTGTSGMDLSEEVGQR